MTVYFGMLVFFLVVILYDYEYVTQAFLDMFILTDVFTKANITPMLTVAGTIFAYFSIVIVNFGDFSRYVKNENELKNLLNKYNVEVNFYQSNLKW